MLMTIGVKMTMKSAGKMKKMSGKSILIGIFCARSSAIALRRLRISTERLRIVVPMETPRRSPCVIDADEDPHVRGVTATTEALDRLTDGEAHPLLLQREPKLLAERVGHALGGDPHRREDSETGLDRHDEQVDHVRHLLVDELHALASLELDVVDGREPAADAGCHRQ